MQRSLVGPLIRQAREAARRSQMDLALDAGVSPRHLSFVELGKSRPSPELIALLADRLRQPLRDRNHWLLAAGYAPQHRETALESAQLAQLRRSLQTVIDAHEPFPAVVIDRRWTVQLTNRAAIRLAEGIEVPARGVPTNIFRVSLHPEGFASRTRNFDEWSGYLLRQLDEAVARTRDDELIALAAEVERWPRIPPRAAWATRSFGDQWPIVPWHVHIGGEDLRFFTTLSTFGTANDVTVSELALELFLPADEHTESVLRAPGATIRT